MADGITKKGDDTLGNLPMLISVLKAAKTLGISPRSLWTLTRAGTIPFIQLGRRVITHTTAYMKQRPKLPSS